jgi:LacI family transcriptional regulator
LLLCRDWFDIFWSVNILIDAEKVTDMPISRIRHTDIAREAGSSVATVDRVLNGRPGVSQHTAQRIHDALHRLEGRGGRVSGPRKPQLRFDYIMPGGPNAFWKLLADGAAAAGDALADEGVVVRCHSVEGFDAQVLADRIRELGAESDGLAVVALENPVVREAVRECFDSGIPLVTMVADLSTQKKVGYVGLENRAAGRTAGYLMGRFLGGRKGRLALFEGSLDLSYRDHQERDIGFRDVLRELFPDLTVTFRNPTHDHHETAYQVTRELLEEHPDILGLYNVGGGIRGNARAIQESGRSNEIVCIGHELTAFSRQYLIDGTMDAVIDQDPVYQAREAARMLLNFHVKGPEATTQQMTQIRIYLRENML